MRIGINLPVMAEGLDRDVLREWCRRIDSGPWSSLALGERINFTNPDAVTMLAAAAAWTERVPLVANVLVPALHHPVHLAKQLATIDVLAEGRLQIGVGVGGRQEDYLAVGADWDVRKLDLLEERVAALRAVWSGKHAHPDALRPVEPATVQEGGPPLLAGSLGPISIRRAAAWADGILGFSFTLGEDELATAFATAREAWTDQGRGAPRLVTGCWYALGGDAAERREQLARYLHRYLNFLGPMAEALIPMVPFHDPAALSEGVDRARDLGADELLLTPTSADPDEVDRAADLLFASTA